MMFCKPFFLLFNFSTSFDSCETVRLWFYSKTYRNKILILHFYPGHIPSLIKADMLDSALTRLVAVNSIYFKGMWKSRFQPENTKMRQFKGGNGNVYKVPMMSQLSVFNIGEHFGNIQASGALKQTPLL